MYQKQLFTNPIKYKIEEGEDFEIRFHQPDQELELAIQVSHQPGRFGIKTHILHEVYDENGKCLQSGASPRANNWKDEIAKQIGLRIMEGWTVTEVFII